MEKESGKITIDQVAKALGVSKTTVSRAISGKGRIGEATRRRVLEYIEENDYKPSIIARGLAQSKTFNICVLLPENYHLSELSFFQKAMVGIQQYAEQKDYDILLCIGTEEDNGSLERIVRNQKVDGVILLRTYRKDQAVELLQKKRIPFVAVGDTDYSGVYQVNHDQRAACRELTEKLLSGHGPSIVLLGGRDSLVITWNRLEGFQDAYRACGLDLPESQIYLNLESREAVEQAADEALEQKCRVLLCMDDVICSWLLRKLQREHLQIPRDVRVASFYNSWVLENTDPAITAIAFDARELGEAACRKLFCLMEQEEAPERTLLPYQILLREST